MEHLNRLKIKYVFIEERHSDKDLENSHDEIISSYFMVWFKKNYLITQKINIKRTIERFFEKFLSPSKGRRSISIIELEPQIFQDIFYHPESLEILKRKIKQAIDSRFH